MVKYLKQVIISRIRTNSSKTVEHRIGSLGRGKHMLHQLRFYVESQHLLMQRESVLRVPLKIIYEYQQSFEKQTGVRGRQE